MYAADCCDSLVNMLGILGIISQGWVTNVLYTLALQKNEPRGHPIQITVEETRLGF